MINNLHESYAIPLLGHNVHKCSHKQHHSLEMKEHLK